VFFRFLRIAQFPVFWCFLSLLVDSGDTPFFLLAYHEVQLTQFFSLFPLFFFFPIYFLVRHFKDLSLPPPMAFLETPQRLHPLFPLPTMAPPLEMLSYVWEGHGFGRFPHRFCCSRSRFPPASLPCLFTHTPDCHLIVNSDAELRAALVLEFGRTERTWFATPRSEQKTVPSLLCSLSQRYHFCFLCTLLSQSMAPPL